MPVRLEPETNCFCGDKVLEKKCLKQQANKEDNFPSSSLPQSPPGGRLLTGSNLAKTKSYFLLGLSTGITKLTIIWWKSIWNKFRSLFPLAKVYVSRLFMCVGWREDLGTVRNTHVCMQAFCSLGLYYNSKHHLVIGCLFLYEDFHGWLVCLSKDLLTLPPAMRLYIIVKQILALE